MMDTRLSPIMGNTTWYIKYLEEREQMLQARLIVVQQILLDGT